MGTEKKEETDIEWLERKIEEGRKPKSIEAFAKAIAEDAARVERGEPSRIRACRDEDFWH